MINKKRLILLITLILLTFCLSACGEANETAAAQPEPEVTEPEVQVTATPGEPEPEAPECAPAIVRVDRLGLLYTLLGRGETYAACGETENYYIIDRDGIQLYVEKRFCRLESQPETEAPLSIFADSGACLYDNPYLSGDAIEVCKKNDELVLLDRLSGVFCIEYNGSTAYAYGASFRESPFGTTWGGTYTEDSPAPQDGGDIDLSGMNADGKYSLSMLRLSMTSDLTGETVIIRADGVEAYFCVFERGDVIQVTEAEDEFSRVYEEGIVGTVPSVLTAAQGGEEYEAWTGYASGDAEFYPDYRMKGVFRCLGLNTEVFVVDCFGDFCLVEVNGISGYMFTADINAEYTAASNSGGYSTSAGTESSANTENQSENGSAQTQPASEWTEPVL